jgi:serine/threonine-protein kinase
MAPVDSLSPKEPNMATPFDDVTVGPVPVAVTPAGAAPFGAGPSRFAPGAIVAGRYRLVALLGRGGMGEVYRADDLTLDQPIALKFLPEGVASSDTRVAQFHNELRVARQVSHKNVCRLYDLGEADGRRFLTMEYVDGEDLSSSLRRFGRMPPDKAVQIARQLCAGISAAHEKGVLHRDLKPANVMLDGNGDVRITDFGIAVLGGHADAGIAGTPQYMAPELLAGKPATTQSDIYALGLILFEVFTGKRAYETKTLGELKRLHDTGTMTTPSSIVHDLDPVVERVILRCLEKDPERRPASALTVAAALPGGDPLAAALAAGETPSPDLLVAAAESVAMPVAPALALLSAFLVVLVLSVAAGSRGSVISQLPVAVPRDALADRADLLLKKLGYGNDVAGRAMGFQFDGDYTQWAQRNGPQAWWTDLRIGRPPALVFWYRTSPEELAPASPAGRVDSRDPPMILPGMRQVLLDTEGRLVAFHSVPPAIALEDAAAAAPWPQLFEAADLDAKSFTQTTPKWLPPAFADATAAWEGPLPGRRDMRVRVEAASYKNHPVSFQIVWPWTEPPRTEASQRTGLQRLTDMTSVAGWVAMLAGGILLARRNLRAGRSDRRGAARLAIGITMASVAFNLLKATHSGSPRVEMAQIFGALAFGVFTGATMWVYYLAIEPYARRFWPDALLGWTRLLSGRIRDPRVGRELLIGLACGAAGVLIDLSKLVPMTLGWRIPLLPLGNGLTYLDGGPALIAQWLNVAVGGLSNALAIALIFLVLRLLLKRPRAALVVGFLVLLLLMNGGSVISGNWFDRFNNIGFTLLITLVMHRFGLLATAMTLFVDNIVTDVPLTTNMAAWWSTPMIASLVMLIAVAGLSYAAARTGQPLFGQLLEE